MNPRHLSSNSVRGNVNAPLELRNETRDDPVLHELMEYVISGFPEHRRHMSPETRLFWSFRDEITMDNGILMKGK